MYHHKKKKILIVDRNGNVSTEIREGRVGIMYILGNVSREIHPFQRMKYTLLKL